MHSMWWTLPFQQKCLLLEFCRLFDPHSFIISLHLYMTNVTNELRPNSLQNLWKNFFVEAVKFTALHMHISLMVFIFWWLARYYPQCIINWQLRKGLLYHLIVHHYKISSLYITKYSFWHQFLTILSKLDFKYS